MEQNESKDANGPKIVVSIVYVIAMFMVSMDGTIVNVILPTISSEFNLDPSSASGINVGYLVSLAVFLPVAGWLGDRFGTKKILLDGIGCLYGSLLFMRILHNLQTLNLFRVLQEREAGSLHQLEWPYYLERSLLKNAQRCPVPLCFP